MLNKDWANDYPKDSKNHFYIIAQDYIPRYSSASSYLCEGVKEGEPVELTTMWTILGYQFCSVAIPTWVSAGPELPKLVISNDNNIAPICNAALKLKEKVFPIKRGNGDSYMNLSSIFNNDESGIYQKLRIIEDEIFYQTELKVNQLEARRYFENRSS